MSIMHSRTSGIPNDPAAPDLIGGEDWDAEHVVDLTAADVGAASADHDHDADYSATGHTHDYEASGAVATHAAAGDPHTGYQKESEKASASGYASLDADTKVPIAQLPTGTTGTTVALGNAAAGLITTHEGAADPHTGYLKENDANWVDLTDGGATTLHTHAGGSGAPTDADYLVGTANGSLSNDIVVGTSPGGELGGTWASPTVDATHSGSTHAATQAAAEATAAGALASHVAAGDPHTGYRLESADHTHASTGLQGGQIAFSALTGYPSITSASAFATATTSISAATYADITGCSVSLAAGTWLVFGHVIAAAANAIIQVFVAITHNDNTVIAESAMSRPASGTASLNSPVSVSWFGIVSPGSTTTYKLRGARGLTTHTGSWTAMDGNGVNTTNHASNNTDKGTGIFAIRIA